VSKARDDGPPVGVRPAGRQRSKVDPVRVAARVARDVDVAPVAEGVTPLNAGFFRLQRMSARSAAKTRGKIRVKIKGK
jgi:hypothetical protein